APDGGLEVAAAHARLEHRLVVAVEALRFQRDRQRLAEQRELAVDAAQRLAVELEAVAREARLRRLRDVEEVRRLQVLVEVAHARIDRAREDRDVGLALALGL